MQRNEKSIGTILLPLLRWPISDPLVQKLRFRPRHFGTTFPVVSAKFGQFPKAFFFLRNPGAPPKNPKTRMALRMGAAEEIEFGQFLKALISSFVWSL